MIIWILETSLQSWASFFLKKLLFIILASSKERRFLKRGRRVSDSQTSLLEETWEGTGGGGVDTVYCSCTVKHHTIPGLRVCLG